MLRELCPTSSTDRSFHWHKQCDCLAWTALSGNENLISMKEAMLSYIINSLMKLEALFTVGKLTVAVNMLIEQLDHRRCKTRQRK